MYVYIYLWFDKGWRSAPPKRHERGSGFNRWRAGLERKTTCEETSGEGLWLLKKTGTLVPCSSPSSFVDYWVVLWTVLNVTGGGVDSASFPHTLPYLDLSIIAWVPKFRVTILPCRRSRTFCEMPREPTLFQAKQTRLWRLFFASVAPWVAP